MDEKLPDNVVSIKTLRIRYDKAKKCTCDIRNFEIDTNNKEVLCGECGAIVQPYDALYEMSIYYERLVKEVENLLEQRKQILNWKPHLLPLRELERHYRNGMLPCCPYCDHGIDAHEFKAFVNKGMEIERRKFDECGKEGNK